MNKIKFSERSAPPHKQYLVFRGQRAFVATPCYGIHEPWWVCNTAVGEVDPAPIAQDDEWVSLSEKAMDDGIGTAYAEVWAARKQISTAQDYTPAQWNRFISSQLDAFDEPRARFVKVAALAIAAIEAIDKK